MTPCFFNSFSAWVRTDACSPIASLRTLSWQGLQIPPLIVGITLPQIMHFFFSCSIVVYFTQKNYFLQPFFRGGLSRRKQGNGHRTSKGWPRGRRSTARGTESGGSVQAQTVCKPQNGDGEWPSRHWPISPGRRASPPRTSYAFSPVWQYLILPLNLSL